MTGENSTGTIAISRSDPRSIARSVSMGFTLLEVLIAMAIFSFGLLALAAMSTVVIKGNDASNRLTVATMLAEQRLAGLSNTAYASLAASAATTTTWDNQDYTITVNKTAGPATGTQIMEVQVSWTGADGNNRTLSLSTLRGNPN